MKLILNHDNQMTGTESLVNCKDLTRHRSCAKNLPCGHRVHPFLLSNNTDLDTDLFHLAIVRQ